MVASSRRDSLCFTGRSTPNAPQLPPLNTHHRRHLPLPRQPTADLPLRSCLTPRQHGSRNERHPRQPSSAPSCLTHYGRPALPTLPIPPPPTLSQRTRYAPSAQSPLPPFRYAAALVNP